jgi:hypothetical protein
MLRETQCGGLVFRVEPVGTPQMDLNRSPCTALRTISLVDFRDFLLNQVVRYLI